MNQDSDRFRAEELTDDGLGLAGDLSEEDIEKHISKHPDDKEWAYVYHTTGPDLVTRCYYSYENKNDIILLETDTFEDCCFGKYGKHNSFGYWKSKENDLSLPLTIH